MADTQLLMGGLLRIPLDQLHPGPNARGKLGRVTDLAVSIRAIGLQEPLLVTERDAGGYQILDGHRRHAAAQKLDLPHLDAVLRRDHGPAARLQQQLAIHAQTAAFDPIAEAEALHILMWEHNLDRHEIARAVGKSPAWVRDRVLLLQLAPAEQDAVRAGGMSLAAALSTVRGRLDERERRRGWVRNGNAAGGGSGTGTPPGTPHCPTCRCEVTDG